MRLSLYNQADSAADAQFGKIYANHIIPQRRSTCLRASTTVRLQVVSMWLLIGPFQATIGK